MREPPILKPIHDGLHVRTLPLRLSLWIGGLVSLAGVGFGMFVFASVLSGAHYVTGWASTVVLVSLLSGLNFLMTGIIGLYVGAIHSEIKQRPVYVVGRAVGFSDVTMLSKPVQPSSDTVQVGPRVVAA